jgi:acyl-CoA thioesterase FadM
MKLAELRKQGYKALTDALGIVGMIRFLQQFDVGEGDYTRDRAQWMYLLTMHDFQAYVREQQIYNRIE